MINRAWRNGKFASQINASRSNTVRFPPVLRTVHHLSLEQQQARQRLPRAGAVCVRKLANDAGSFPEMSGLMENSERSKNTTLTDANARITRWWLPRGSRCSTAGE
jgi:hypothetical protein